MDDGSCDIDRAPVVFGDIIQRCDVTEHLKPHLKFFPELKPCDGLETEGASKAKCPEGFEKTLLGGHKFFRPTRVLKLDIHKEWDCDADDCWEGFRDIAVVPIEVMTWTYYCKLTLRSEEDRGKYQATYVGGFYGPSQYNVLTGSQGCAKEFTPVPFFDNMKVNKDREKRCYKRLGG